MEEQEGSGVEMSFEPTQVSHPWRATVRTIFAAVVGFAAMWPVIVEALGLDPAWVWVSVSIAVTGGITRIMALPQVNEWMERHVPWLAAGRPTESVGSEYQPRHVREI